jgi:PAT family beta-lactamase induction signal transducer AmpG
MVGAAIAGVVVAQRQWRVLDPIVGLVRGAVEGAPLIGRISLPGWIALALLASLLVVLAFLGPIKRRVAASNSYYGAAFVDFLARPKVGLVLAFVVLFRTGESFLQKMKWPFLRDDLGMSLDEYGFANGTLGVIASFVGTFLGGWLISRHGLKRWIWPFVLAQNTLNLLYALLAWVGTAGGVGLGIITLVITAEHFGEGLGTAVFMVYLMRSCDPAHKAAHMAILTALMSVSFTVAGVASGFLAGWLGFSTYFAFTFLAAVPGMVLIFFIPNKH